MSHPPIGQQITFIYTRDLERSVQFYETVMGFELWLDQGSCRIYHISGTAYIGVCQTGSSAKGTVDNNKQTNIILTLVTDDVDEWYKTLQQRGVNFEKAPEENPTYRIYHCFLRDPDGYLIEIQNFLDLD
jgi:catechol 2,3-dioxygenase-like lactoylglutathione lyase family enzyme